MPPPVGTEGVHLQVTMGLTALAPPEGWELQARCREVDPQLFFGPPGFEPKRDRIAREAAAKEICATCPAVAACREHALRSGELYGVWGGLGEADRRNVLAQRERYTTAVAG